MSYNSALVLCFAGGSFCAIIQLQYCVLLVVVFVLLFSFSIVFSGGSFFSYNSASVLCFLVVVFVLLFNFSIVFSGGRFRVIIQLQYCAFWW